MQTTSRHRVVIAGGGDAGISVAARLLKAGERDIAVIEPSDVRYYQPLWTLVGGGCAPVEKSVRPEMSVMPKGAKWIKDRAVDIDPEAQTVGVGSGGSVGYDFLIGVVILDVRRPDEWEAGHLAGAVHIPFWEREDRMAEVPDGDVSVHCASGFRASISASLLDRAGLRVVHVDDDWSKAADTDLVMAER